MADYKFTVRMPTGSVSSSDIDSEWQELLVNNPAGNDTDVWNWKGIASWTSTTPSGSSANRVIRGNAAANTWSSVVSSTINTTTGFRPVLEIESLVPPFILLNKSLVLSGGSYQKWQPAETQEGDMVKDLTYSEEGTLLRYNLHKALTNVEVE